MQLRSLRRFAHSGLLSTVLSTCLLSLAALMSPVLASAQTGSVDFTANQQQVEGFGFAEAFGAAKSVSYLSPAQQSQVWDLMFNPKTGAGLTALRLGINTDSQIEPNSPGSPTATPSYAFDGSDGNQVQAAQIAQHYGVNNFFATSWSAPPFMKTTGTLNNAGALCGTVGATCASGDWRQAYANFLVQYINFYKGVGVPIGALDFVNEPDFNPVSYASMNMTNNQVIDFIQNAFGPTMRAKAPGTRTMCCDGFNWASETVYTGAFPYYPLASSYTDIITGHEYGYAAKFAQGTTKPVWMTEWATLSNNDELRWDCGGCGDSDGMYLANDLIQAFNTGNVNEYNYWWGTVNSANALVEVYLSLTAPGTFKTTGRYYAMSALSRYVRPGAYRVQTANSNSNLNVVAFRNTDGSKVLEVLNNGAAATSATFGVDAGTAKSAARTLLTDQTDSLAETDSAVIAGNALSLSLPARSLTTVLLPPATVSGTVQLLITPTLQKLGDGSYQAAVKITNNGTGTAQGVTLTGATLGSAQGSPTPLSALPEVAGTGSIAPGGFTVVPMNFGASAGTSGAASLQRFTGTYNGGSFGGSYRVTLP